MRGILLVLFSTILVCQRACSQVSPCVCRNITDRIHTGLQYNAPVPKQLILPPPPPPPPNSPPNFDRDDDKAGKTTVAPKPPDPLAPIPQLMESGGAELVVAIEFKSFQSTQEERFKSVMSDTSNNYCATKGNCVGDVAKIVDKDDVIVYDIQSVKTKRTAASFYIKNPEARTLLTMTTKQLEMMFAAERLSMESTLGYLLDFGDLDGFVPFTNGLALESWLIALLALIGLFIVVFGFVAIVNYRNKKTDTKITFDDLEMQQYQNNTKVLPSGPVVPASSLKKAKVDATTNVYQSEILAETKSVFIKPSMVKKRAVTDTELYAVVHKHKEVKKQEEGKQKSIDPPASPNAIVVTADVSSSNDGNSHSSEEEPTSPTSNDDNAPPDYEQATTEDEAKVIEGPGADVAATTEVAVASEVPPAPTTDEDLPPPPPPAAEPDSDSSASVDLPPPPPPTEAKDPSTSGASSQKDSGSSSSQSSAKDSSHAGKEAEEVVGELENLIADQTKEISGDDGLDNGGFETIVDDYGQPSTEL